MQKFFILFVCCLLAFGGKAQNDKLPSGFDIRLLVKKFPYSGTAKLGFYSGNAMLLADSTAVDTLNNTLVFKGEKTLAQGMYFILLPQSEPIDIVITDDATFQLSTVHQALIDSLEVKGSKENEAYSTYLKKVQRFKRQMEQLDFNGKLLQRATRDPEAFQPIRDNMMQERKILDLATENFIKENSKLWCAKVVKAATPPKVPAHIKPIFEKNSPNPAYYKYFREHLWDDFDFNDLRFQRTKIIEQKISTHLSQLTFQQADSINQSVDFILKKAAVNRKMLAYFQMQIFQRFDNNYLPGADRVLVHLVDKFYPDEKDTTLADIATLTRIRYKADMNRKNLTGNIAKEMRLLQPDSTYLSLMGIQSKYTMLYFYSPLCMHCKEKTPGVYKIFEKYREKGLACYAVNTDREVAYWRNYIKTEGLNWFNVSDPERAGTWESDYVAFNLPVIYLLDENKKILIKRVEVEKLDALLQSLFAPAR